jgi:hypothetical protein
MIGELVNVIEDNSPKIKARILGEARQVLCPKFNKVRHDTIEGAWAHASDQTKRNDS